MPFAALNSRFGLQRLHSLSLKARVTLFTLGIFLLSVWSLALYAGHMLRQDMQRLLGEQQFSTVSLLATEMNQQVEERLAALKAVAGQISAAHMGHSAQLQTLLEQNFTLQAHFNAGVTVLRADGTVIADVPRGGGRLGANYAQSDVGVATLRQGRTTVGKPVIGRAQRAPIIVLSTAILDAQGQVVGALSGVINLDKPNFLDLVMQSRYGKSGGYLLIAPSYRLIVSATDKSRTMETLPAVGLNPVLDRFIQGFEGSDLLTNPLGQHVLASTKGIPAAGWYLASYLPAEEAFKPIREIQLRLFLATLLFTLVVAVLTSRMLKRQLAPMLAAARTMDALSATGQAPQPLPIARQDEIGTLIGGFNHLLQTLQLRETALRESEERHRTLVEWSPEAIIVHRAGTFIYVNPAAIALFGATSAQELIGKRVFDLIHPDFHPVVLARLLEHTSAGRAAPMIEEKYYKLDGTPMDLEVQSRPIVFDGMPAIHTALRDITARKAAQEKIESLAFFDPLTGLPNRRLLIDRLEQALAASARHHREGALLFIDLDNFKDLNDSLGHDMGDLLLQQVAQRLGAGMREGDTVARLGGDEFVVILEDLSPNPDEAAAQAEAVGEKILCLLARTYQLSGHEHHSTPSIGVTLFNDHVETVAELLRRADLAMYQAKASGRNTLRFFDPAMQARVSARSALEVDLHRGLAGEQFSLYYQGQISGERQLVGAEVLLRWNHPERGLVSPAEFIPVAEETGLILPLGKWVLETACRQLTVWAGQPDRAHLSISVNVSAKQLHQVDFVAEVLEVLARTGANPRRLKLELTESLLVAKVEEVIAKMVALKAAGVGFSLDDFGTGYSSLSYLKRLPLDQLKIDQGFVRNILHDANDAAIAKMVIALAGSLGLSVIAEGVETEAQRRFLAAQGCPTYQGYLFNRPQPIEAFEVFVGRCEAEQSESH
jgi:diguanylate cyclase (GGDEF)-like protein/PAS domain S-box-containing protein